MFKILIIGLLAASPAFAAPKLQDSDFATSAQITGAGGTVAQLLNSSKMYNTVDSEIMNTSIARWDAKQSSLTFSAPLVNTAGTVTCNAASGSVTGCLSSTDWTTFNSKGSGTVTSVAASVPAFLSISGSPITTSGTLAITLSGAALPIANGGTSATTKAGAFDSLSPMTTGGDLIYGGASGTGTRLANGTAGQFLLSAGTTLAPVWTTVSYQSPISLGAFGSTPNANGLSFSSNVLTMQPFDSTNPGGVTASGGGTTNFLRADGTWAAPSGGGGSGLSWQSVQTTGFTATAGNAYPVNTTSSAITVTLPASPTAGQQVQVNDYAGTWGTNNITISPNGKKINGSTLPAVIAQNRYGTILTYIDATQGWLLTSSNTIIPTQTTTANYVVVGGGGGGGANSAGGGGGGGYLSGSATLIQGTVYTVTIGAQANGGVSGTSAGVNGNNSSLVGGAVSIIATGGGAGGSQGVGITNGSTGGSGGGGAAGGGFGASGTGGQGNTGGNSNGSFNSGGGGGCGSIGGAAAGGVSGNGGTGCVTSITGSSITLAAGGGGGAQTGTAGTGTSGVSGNGGQGSVNGTSGTSNTGGGGGGAGISHNGGNGASGVVYISVPTANYSGVTTGSPTVTTSGSNTIMMFTSSGSYTG